MDLSMDLVQKQVLSQRMIQSMEILQMSTQELESYLENLSLENPVIELGDPDGHDAETEVTDLQRKLEWLESTDFQNRAYYRQEPQNENPENNWRDTLQDQENLQDYLLSQLLFAEYNSTDRKVIEYIIQSLDSRGYFTEDISFVAEYFSLPEPHIISLLDAVQKLEPAGVGARNLQECLLLQLARVKGPYTEETPAEKIVRHCLDDMAKNHLHEISKKLQLPMSAVREACDEIRSLNPKPGNSFSNREQLRYITPDAVVVMTEHTFQIMISDYQYPGLSISGYYKHMMDTTDDRETREYLQKKVQQAEWIFNCIQQRSSTLMRVMQAIVDTQADFFKYGAGHKKPMRLKDIAGTLDLHESTVSRAMHGKYLQCAWGMFPLNYFLTSIATKSAQTEETSATPDQVKERIWKIVNGEDKKKPYSDQAISDKLKAMGILISRRTVNKYRQEMNLPDKSGRKSWD